MFLNPLKHWQHQLWWCCTEMDWVCHWREQAGLACLAHWHMQERQEGPCGCWERGCIAIPLVNVGVFALWQRISELIQEHQNFLPLLFFPLGLLGLQVRNPSNIPWSMRWQLKLGQTVLNRGRPGLPCRASTRAVTRTVSWKAAATAATRESRRRTPTSCLWRISYQSLCLGHHHFGAHRVTARWSLRVVLLNTSQWGCRIKDTFWQSAQKSALVMENML